MSKKQHPYNTCYDPFGNTVATENNAVWQILSPINYEAYKASPESLNATEDLVSDIDRAIEHLEELRDAVKVFTYGANTLQAEVDAWASVQEEL
tara:strand:+ start:2079 stop:2360 length:282 start_codon:yes stop_codon:yes gene_type:complete